METPLLILAPMDDVTDTVFRQVVQDCAPPDMTFTEFVNVDGLMSVGRARLLKKLRFVASEKNLVAQLWGLKPENFKAVAQQIADGSLARELGLPEGHNFVGVDLNMGCPAKSEVSHGACSALIENRPLAKEIIDATSEGLAGRLPLSVKTRVGFSHVDMSWIEFLLEQKLSMLIIHGRTRKEMSKVPANWDLIGEARELRDKLTVNTLIIGNGDVMSRQQAEELAAKYQLDGVMIGRGVFHDPYLFAQESPWESLAREDRLELYRKHVQLFADTWQNGERAVHTLNKFCKIYVNGFDGAKELREHLMAAESTNELLSILDESRQAQPTT
ncbi:MAG: tRNA-dihydrouridine synthase [Candidatus Saccharibacteria bacterium]|nr:tRNA-dihydrouridine synthase [Candidatus Saccharibacteria bacterium]